MFRMIACILPSTTDKFMVPLFDSEWFAFIDSADGELIINCRECHREADAQIDTVTIALLASCPECGVRAEFRFRPSVSIAPSYRIAKAS